MNESQVIEGTWEEVGEQLQRFPKEQRFRLIPQENKVGYQEAFRDIVLKPFREDEEINQEVNQYLVAYQQSRTEFSSFDHYIRMTILGYARTPCETRALALLYSYIYMPMHLDGNKKVIEREYQTFFNPYIYQKPSNVLMIDVGCGP
ncbi:MAG: hypothetical protein JWN14_4417, partial [Chthonomonadales bacterium]|nr:hypothetical protein [Chthonomonadales bacterium]